MVLWLTLLECHCTQLNYQYQKLGFMIVSSLTDLSTLTKSNHITINQKDQVLIVCFHHHGTMMHSTITCRTSNIYFPRSSGSNNSISTKSFYFLQKHLYAMVPL